jgi:N-acetylglucosaminyl-diphospho-decaprenol L-rhamnosyltransferase
MLEQETPAAPRTVLAVIVSYKSAGLVKNLLASLAAEKAPEASRNISFRAVVIDNASGDAETLQQTVMESGYQDWVTVIAAPRNGGFAYGNNLGFRHGMESANVPDYFFLLNPDTEVRSSAITPLVRFLDRNPGAGIAASSLEAKDGQLWPFAFRYPSLLSEFEHGVHLGLLSKLLRKHIVMRRMGSSSEQVDWFPGASMMVRRKVIEDLGGMDENYFLYYEETDFCLKVTRAGWTNWYVPESRVMHIAGETTGVTGKGQGKQRLPDYWFESRRRYFAKNHGLGYAVATDVARLVAHVAGELKEKLKPQGSPGVPRFTRDLFRHGFLHKSNWTPVPAQEWRPDPKTTPPAG